jgi:hypothetical protein
MKTRRYRGVTACFRQSSSSIPTSKCPTLLSGTCRFLPGGPNTTWRCDASACPRVGRRLDPLAGRREPPQSGLTWVRSPIHVVAATLLRLHGHILGAADTKRQYKDDAQVV